MSAQKKAIYSIGGHRGQMGGNITEDRRVFNIDLHDLKRHGLYLGFWDDAGNVYITYEYGKALDKPRLVGHLERWQFGVMATPTKEYEHRGSYSCDPKGRISGGRYHSSDIGSLVFKSGSPRHELDV